MRRLAIAILICLALSPTREAAAQGFINPFIGTTLTSPTDTGSASQPGWGIALGSVGKIIGFESEFAYFPELLDNEATGLSKSRVVTFSGNTLIGPTIGPIKVYGAFGFGALYLDVKSVSSIVVPDPDNITSTHFTFNAGGGLMGFFGSHFGLRGDLRYYKAFGFDQNDVAEAGLRLDEFEFWRAAGGIIIKF